MQQKKPDVDVIHDVLRSTVSALPDSVFVNSLLQQYRERGFLSKKQLEGLHGKALKTGKVAPARLATLEAIIKKMPTRYKSEKPVVVAAKEEDGEAKKQIEAILAIHPAHKRMLYQQARLRNRDVLSKTEVEEVERLYKLLVMKGSEGGK
jgi:hypothetical protein